MEPVWIVALALGALVLGALLGWLLRASAGQRERTRLDAERTTAVERASQLERAQVERSDELRALNARMAEGAKELLAARSGEAGLRAELVAEQNKVAEQLVVLQGAETKLRETFQALAAEALRVNSSSFLDLAKERLQGQTAEGKKELELLLEPMKGTLGKLDEHVRDLETKRATVYGELSSTLEQMRAGQSSLQKETGNLVKALRSPQVRGRWGEIGLKRLVEMAGMLEHVDFDTQGSVDSEDGRVRPDMVIHLPGSRDIVLDAKTPLSAFLEAHEATEDAAREVALDQHAKQVRDRVMELSSKGYWQQFQPAPDFVILFLPAESLYFAALQRDPSLIELGITNRVHIATPATLVPILRTVAFGWRQERIAENAERISELGRELHKRISTFSAHLARVGTSLNSALRAYNSAAGSFDSRVLVAARRFRELGASTAEEIDAPALIEGGSTPLLTTAMDAVSAEYADVSELDASDEPGISSG